MKKFVLFSLLLAFSISLFAQNEAEAGKEDMIPGTYVGKLTAPNGLITLVVNIMDAEGTYTATLDSPDQGALSIPVDDVFLVGDSVYLRIRRISGGISGVFDEGYTKITGEFHQGNFSAPIVLERTEESFVPNRPQEPIPPFPYISRDVRFYNKPAAIMLAGTLTLPDTTKPVPAVILISGSGPQNRDEEIFGHKPFLVLADYLTRRGIAVLRFDDRGTGDSEGDFEVATTHDFMTDVQAAFNFLRENKNIDNSKIGLLGHSEGALIGPMMAAENKNVDFLVLLAAPAVNGEKLVLKQNKLIMQVNGAPENMIDQQTNLLSEVFKVVENTPDNAEAKEKVKAIVKKSAAADDDANTPTLSDEQTNQFAETFVTPWFRYFLSYDPVPALEKIKCPVLALYGGNDLQVPPAQNMPVLKKTFEESGNAKVKIEEIPELNHLFQESDTGSPSEYGRIEQTFDPRALRMIGDWIIKVTY
jgi:pimeloyl-ACP methyl ester carboxylesterase